MTALDGWKVFFSDKAGRINSDGKSVGSLFDWVKMERWVAANSNETRYFVPLGANERVLTQACQGEGEGWDMMVPRSKPAPPLGEVLDEHFHGTTPYAMYSIL